MRTRSSSARSATRAGCLRPLLQRWRSDGRLHADLKAAIHRFTVGLAAEVSRHPIAVNLVAPVGGVHTPGLDSLGLGFGPDHPAVEVPEQIAEAALHLVSGDPRERTGIIAWSHRYLDEIGRPTMSLDGRTVVVAC